MSSFKELINGNTPVLVDFYADWCGPCKMMAPYLEEVSRDLKGQVKVIKVDVDKNQSASAAYQIQSIPTLLLFKQGKVVWRQSGVVPPQQIKQAIQNAK